MVQNTFDLRMIVILEYISTFGFKKLSPLNTQNTQKKIEYGE